jgi:hypothetical protein
MESNTHSESVTASTKGSPHVNDVIYLHISKMKMVIMI